MFRIIVCVAAGVIAGFALGGVKAKRELAAVTAERDAARARLAHVSRPNLLEALLPGIGAREGGGMPGDLRSRSQSASPQQAPSQADPEPPEIRRPAPSGDVAVIGAAREDSEGRAPEIARPASDATPEVLAEEAPRAQPAQARPDATGDREGRSRGRGLLAGFDQLVTAQRARSVAARSALVAHAGLSDEQVARFDSAVTRMNGKLGGYGEEVIAQAASEQPPTPAQALGLGHDVSGILYEVQTELDALIGDRADVVDPSALEIWNYVDLEQWRPYVEKQLAGGAMPSTSAHGAGEAQVAPGTAGSGAAQGR
jgi:hypothetical protein